VLVAEFVPRSFDVQIAASGTCKPQDWPYTVHVLAHVVNHDL